MSASEAIDKIRSSDPNTWLYIQGNLNGFGWYNGILIADKHNLYCPPPKLSITVDQAADIMSRFIEKKQGIGKEPVGGVLLYSLIDTFPCGEK
jgi:hypothetical protein